MSLAEVGGHYGKNESSILSIVLNSMHPEQSQFILNSGLLGAIYPQDIKGLLYIDSIFFFTHIKMFHECQVPAAHTAPIILATQEAEIRRIMVQNQPRQIVHETLTRKTLHKKRKKEGKKKKKGWWSGSR
jgi:hypothetical protein